MSMAYFQSPRQRIGVVVTAYSTQVSSQIQAVQIRNGLIHNPRKVGQNVLRLTIRCRSIEEQRRLEDWFRARQKDALLNGVTTNFFYPSQGINWHGLIMNCPAGATKFQYAPTIDIEMLLVKDLVSTQTKVFSQMYGSVDDLTYGQVEDGTEDFATPMVPAPEPPPLIKAPTSPIYTNPALTNPSMGMHPGQQE